MDILKFVVDTRILKISAYILNFHAYCKIICGYVKTLSGYIKIFSWYILSEYTNSGYGKISSRYKNFSVDIQKLSVDDILKFLMDLTGCSMDIISSEVGMLNNQ